MFKAKVFAVGTELEFEEASQKELWKRLAFFQSLPDTCPIDDTPTRFYYKEPDGNSYFSVVNTGQLHLEYKLGQYKESKDDLFGKGEWWWWDWENKQDILLCKWGELTPEGEAMRERLTGSAPVAHKGPQATQNNAPSKHAQQPAKTQQRPPVSVEDELDAITVDSAEPMGWNADEAWAAIPDFEGKTTPPAITAEQATIMHALGSTFYGDGWNAKRHEICQHFGVDSSRKLSRVQAAKIIAGFEKNTRKAIKENEDKVFPMGELMVVLAEAAQSDSVTIDDADAMTLYKVLKEMKERLAKPKEVA